MMTLLRASFLPAHVKNFSAGENAAREHGREDWRDKKRSGEEEWKAKK